MLEYNEIKDLLQLLNQSTFTSFHFEQGSTKFSFEKNIQSSVKPVQKESFYQEVTPLPLVSDTNESNAMKEGEKKEENRQKTSNETFYEVKAPMVGTFYRASNPDVAPFVSEGEKVQKNTVVCMLEAMKLFNEIEAETNGEIVKFLVENGQLVEYGQPLFLVRPL